MIAFLFCFLKIELNVMQKIRLKIQKPSDDFFKFLETVNLLHGWQLPSYSVLIEHFRYGNSGEAIWEARDATQKILLETIKSHSEFCRYIFGQSPDEEISDDKFWERIRFYETFRNDRETLLQTVEKLSNKSATENTGKTFINIISAQVLIEVNPSGQLTFKNIGFKNFENLDVRRFKVCPVCADIFWAFRSDKKACSKCSIIYRQRVFQNKNKAAIKEKRRANYEQNKKLKELRKKKNVII